jgi:hypothetical protein
MLLIRTVPEGYNSGRTYYLKAPSEGACDLIIRSLSKACKAAAKRLLEQTRFQRTQKRVLTFYFSAGFQSASCLLILLVLPRFCVVLCSSS